MTLTLEIAPEIERALEVKARRRGLDVAALLVELARREAAAPEAASEDKGAAFAALTAELMPVIEAGTIVPLGSVGATELLDAVREERDAELTSAVRRAA